MRSHFQNMLLLCASVALTAACTSAHASAPSAAKKRRSTSATHASAGNARSRGSSRSSGSSHSRGGHGGKASAVKGHRKGSGTNPIRAASIHQAFIASSNLRPMAQQLAVFRSPQAYSAVESFATSHAGDASAAAYLALGHAYSADKRWDDSARSYREAGQRSATIDDYTDYLGALSQEQGGHADLAQAQLSGYSGKYPDSIFIGTLPIVLARLQLENGQAPLAMRTLGAASGLAGKSDYQLLKGRAELAAGDAHAAAATFRHIYVEMPTTSEAKAAQQQLTTLASTGVVLTAQDQHAHADALFNAHKYSEALGEFETLEHHPDIGESMREDIRLDIAVCSWKLKKLTKAQLSSIPDTNTDHGAQRLYLLMEDARTRKDFSEAESYTNQLERRFPHSDWYEQALMSTANMYLIANQLPQAIPWYDKLCRNFPHSSDADLAHWRQAWLTYRGGDFAQAGTLMDQQISRYGGGPNVPDALYWRGRILEERQQQPALAKAYYAAEVRAYRNFYFGGLAKDRLLALAKYPDENVPLLGGIHEHSTSVLTDTVPTDNVHVAKARLLGNAGLNEYIGQEIRVGAGDEGWAQWAEIQIYTQSDQPYRALQVAKRITPSYYAVPISSIPQSYWSVLFPKPYWGEVQADSQADGLDPYLVLSLIRQESEFNPSVVSYANAYGLMQLLPSTGAQMAHKTGTHASTEDLLNPAVNLKLGTAYLKQTVDRYHGVIEYTLASYNAGESRVDQWVSEGHFRDVPEFVESIPFSQTHDYVQAILRNEAMYKRLNGVTAQ